MRKSMNIIVCIKQVPGTAQVEIDEKTGVLKRDGVAAKMNPFDLFALESAMRLKEKFIILYQPCTGCRTVDSLFQFVSSRLHTLHNILLYKIQTKIQRIFR